jgi:hypothetical protein
MGIVGKLNLYGNCNKLYGRIAFYSAVDFHVIGYSWLKLDITKYIGKVFYYKKHVGALYLFYCKKNGYFYMKENHLKYIYIASSKHKEYKTTKLIGAALKDYEQANF